MHESKEVSESAKVIWAWAVGATVLIATLLGVTVQKVYATGEAVAVLQAQVQYLINDSQRIHPP